MKYTGVIYSGPVYDMAGYGTVARGYLKALEHIGMPIKIHNSEQVYADAIGKDTVEWIRGLSTNNLGDRIAFIHHSAPPLLNGRAININNVVKKIGITLYETDHIPMAWAGLCNSMDEIWVPSKFNFETFSSSGVSSWKMKIVPYAIDLSKYNPNRRYVEMLSEHGDRFKFLYASGFDHRKGYDLLIKSYCEEFTSDDNVVLLIKLYVPSWSTSEDIANQIKSFIPADKAESEIPNISIMIHPMTQDELTDLYQSCDAFISTERASGWGMPEMECMALGKPVASIDWGGSTEFITSENGFPIPAEPELEPVDMRLQTARPQFYAGHKWRKVKPESVRKVMREIYENKELRDHKAQQAAKDMEKFSVEAIANQLKELL